MNKTNKTEAKAVTRKAAEEVEKKSYSSRLGKHVVVETKDWLMSLTGYLKWLAEVLHWLKLNSSGVIEQCSCVLEEVFKKIEFSIKT